MSGKPKPPVVLYVPVDVAQEAGEYLAQRAASPELAESYRSGCQRQGWAFRHVVDRMMRERAV